MGIHNSYFGGVGPALVDSCWTHLQIFQVIVEHLYLFQNEDKDS